MIYRRKPTIVDAVEWKTPLINQHDLPEWMYGALLMKSHSLFGKIKVVGDDAQVMTAKGTAMARPGDFIVYYSKTSRTLEVFTADEFNSQFEPFERRPKVRGWQDTEKR